jgi:hypothetical protein
MRAWQDPGMRPTMEVKCATASRVCELFTAALQDIIDDLNSMHNECTVTGTLFIYSLRVPNFGTATHSHSPLPSRRCDLGVRAPVAAAKQCTQNCSSSQCRCHGITAETPRLFTVAYIRCCCRCPAERRPRYLVHRGGVPRSWARWQARRLRLVVSSKHHVLRQPFHWRLFVFTLCGLFADFIF